MRRTVVTGGAGFIGSHLAAALVNRGLEVTVLDNLSVGKRERVPAGARFIEGDILDDNAIAEAVENADVVFHNAARVSIRSSMEYSVDDAQTNVIGTIKVLEESRRRGVKRFILASSMAVYGDSLPGERVDERAAPAPISPYGIGKLAAEYYACRLGGDGGMATIVLRYFNTYGLHQTLTPYVGVITIFINRLLSGEAPVIFGDGEQTRDFVSVADIVQANLAAMERGRHGLVANVGSGRPRTVNEVARLLIARILPSIAPLFARAHPGELRYSVADIKVAERELGYVPRGILEADIDDIISHLKASRTQSAA